MDIPLSGTRLLKSLARRGVACTYGGLNALAAEMPRADVVLLGAAAVLSNGNALARRGAASVAYLAKAHNRPLLVTVKSFQFMDKASAGVLFTHRAFRCARWPSSRSWRSTRSRSSAWTPR